MTKTDRDQQRAAPLQDNATPADSDPLDVALTDEVEAPSADIQLYIGAQLRAVYDDVARQPIPDRFVDLMKRLG